MLKKQIESIALLALTVLMFQIIIQHISVKNGKKNRTMIPVASDAPAASPVIVSFFIHKFPEGLAVCLDGVSP